jgi:uncharacterized membrane protein
MRYLPPPESARRLDLDEFTAGGEPPARHAPPDFAFSPREDDRRESEDFRTLNHWLLEYDLRGTDDWVDESNPLERDTAQRRRRLVELAPPREHCLLCAEPAARTVGVNFGGRHLTVEARGEKDARIERSFELPLELPYCSAHYDEFFGKDLRELLAAAEPRLPEGDRGFQPDRDWRAAVNRLSAPGVMLEALFDEDRRGFRLRWRFHRRGYLEAFVAARRQELAKLDPLLLSIDELSLAEAELRRRLEPPRHTAYALSGAVGGALLAWLAAASPGWPGWLAWLFGAGGAVGLAVFIHDLLRRGRLRRRLAHLLRSG